MIRNANKQGSSALGEASEKRLQWLEQKTASPDADNFSWYALAMEYKSLGRTTEALRAFETLRGKDPRNVTMYLMVGQMMAQAGQKATAREWLEQGCEQAQKSGQIHAHDRMKQLLESLG